MIGSLLASPFDTHAFEIQESSLSKQYQPVIFSEVKGLEWVKKCIQQYRPRRECMHYRVINRIRYGIILLIVFLAFGAISLSASSDLFSSTSLLRRIA